MSAMDLGMVDTAWLRRQIGVVLQENVLFNRSVRENIALANPAAPMEQVGLVSHMAQVGANTVITLDANNSITLNNVNASSLQSLVHFQ